MNSPPEPASPSTSTPSSGSPPPEEINFQVPESQSSGSFAAGGDRATLGPAGASSKRRLPAGGSFGNASSRDPKSRRRDDPRKYGSGGGPNWAEGPKREKEDLVDQHVVDLLRNQLGDPFLE
ncbi:hypothetical protein PLEOSDRAFT_1099030 [Pleurotus ostreatus PC15]|uniref:Uncharacterized protein n=1 Tax=Pleurotus ostreatus (strain PC15) TaxID=1137138 RepID=A0A067P9E7_PLEO1|nr:hypothetical protein PLEOSDRAFT_1099030 [Pleurotus ostreatus PC15]